MDVEKETTPSVEGNCQFVTETMTEREGWNIKTGSLPLNFRQSRRVYTHITCMCFQVRLGWENGNGKRHFPYFELVIILSAVYAYRVREKKDRYKKRTVPVDIITRRRRLTDYTVPFFFLNKSVSGWSQFHTIGELLRIEFGIQKLLFMWYMTQFINFPAKKWHWHDE